MTHPEPAHIPYAHKMRRESRRPPPMTGLLRRAKKAVEKSGIDWLGVEQKNHYLVRLGAGSSEVFVSLACTPRNGDVEIRRFLTRARSALGMAA